MVGQLKEEQIDTLLKSCMVGRVACHSNGKVYVVPVTYAYDGKNIYSHTKEGMKVDMMRENPRVCFEVDQIDNLSNWRSALVWGTFQELRDQEADMAMQLLINRFMPFTTSVYSLPVRDLHAKEQQSVAKYKEVVYKIAISEKTGRFEKRN